LNLREGLDSEWLYVPVSASGKQDDLELAVITYDAPFDKIKFIRATLFCQRNSCEFDVRRLAGVLRSAADECYTTSGQQYNTFPWQIVND
jgi:hypothetical protein